MEVYHDTIASKDDQGDEVKEVCASNTRGVCSGSSVKRQVFSLLATLKIPETILV